MEGPFRELVIRIKESIEDRNSVPLDSITEDALVEGMIDLFKKSQVNNVVEYFRKYRKVENIIECPFSCLLLEKKSIKYKTLVQTNYKRIFRTKGHFSKVLCMMFDRSETFIFTGGEDGIIKIWDVYSGRVVKSLTEHLSPIFDFVIDYSNRYFISCDQTGTIIVWDLRTYSKVKSVTIGEQIDYLDIVYEEEEAEPLEQKKQKKPASKKRKDLVKAVVVTNSGRILKISVNKEIEVEIILKEIEEGTFNGAVTTRGKRMVVVTGMWPFSVLFDVGDPDNRFYVLNTEDMISSSIDISHNSLKFAIGTYSSILMIWEYEIGQKPIKGNIPTRKRFKGRDLEGCWRKTTIDLEGMSESIYNTDIIYLIDDITVVAVDTESNIRIINTETKNVKIIEKEYKITGIISHPIHNIFLTVEVNGVIKVIDSTGNILKTISTGVSVAGTIVIDSTGGFFYIADLDGYMYKYSIVLDRVEVPETEYLLEDFDHYHRYNTEQIKAIEKMESEGHPDTEGMGRVYSERNSIIDRVREICIRNKTQAAEQAYTAEGEALSLFSIDGPFPSYTQTVDKWIRSIEVSGILQLQSEMITGSVFEKEYMREPQNIVVQETEEETTSENNGESSSNWEENETDNSFGTDTESPEDIEEDLSSGKTVCSVDDESEDESEVFSVHSSNSEGTSRSGSEESFRRSPQILSRKRGRRQAARKALCPDVSEIYTWYMSDKPVYPILPQTNEEIILLRSNIVNRQLKSKVKEEEANIRIVGIDYLTTEIRVKFVLEDSTSEHVLVYGEAQEKASPFLLKKQQIDIRKKRYVKNEEIYFYRKGILGKGTVVKKKDDEITVKTDTSTMEINVRDVYSPLINYSIDLTKYLPALTKYAEEYPIFYKEVSKTAYPDYYEIISKPMPLKKIIQRIKNKYYRTKEEFICDINTVYSNCREYNEENSEISAECKNLVEALLNEVE